MKASHPTHRHLRSQVNYAASAEKPGLPIGVIRTALLLLAFVVTVLGLLLYFYLRPHSTASLPHPVSAARSVSSTQ